MAPKKAGKATAPAAAVDTKIPFDPEKQEILLDLKGLCALPYDQNMSAVQSFRAMIFPKGKYIHEPRKPGRYLVLGQWRSVTALSLVHFNEKVNRSPELLLDFHDFGMASATSMHGTMITTIQLPLLVSNGVYQKHTRVTTVDDVIAFETLDASKLPYSKDLAPFLKTQELYRSLNVASVTELLGYIHRGLGPRIESVSKRAQLKLAAHVDELAEVEKEKDPDFAAKEKDALSVKLTDLVESFRSLPPESYDATLSTRIKTIEMVDPPDHAEVQMPSWLTTPLKTALAEGKACGDFTRLYQAGESAESARVLEHSQAAGPSSMAAIAEELLSSSSSSSSSPDDDDGDDDHDDDDEEEDDGGRLADDPSPIPLGPRKRKKVDHFVPAAGKASKKAKAVAVAPTQAPVPPKPPKPPRGSKAKANETDLSCAPGFDPKAPFGRNRRGKAYKRACGAYKQSLHPPRPRTTSAADESLVNKLVTDLRSANQILTNKVAALESEVARLKAVEGKAEEVARLQGERDKHKDYHDAFMKGLDKGLSMASGQLVVTSGAPPSGRSG